MVRGLLLAALLVLAPATPAGFEAAGPFQGRAEPSEPAQEGPVYLIWEDGEGVHLRVRNMGRPRRFHGQVFCDGVLSLRRPADKSWQVRRPDRARLLFDLAAFGELEARPQAEAPGLDLEVRAERLGFLLEIDGRAALRDEVQLGRHSVRPSSLPLLLERVPMQRSGHRPSFGPS